MYETQECRNRNSKRNTSPQNWLDIISGHKSLKNPNQVKKPFIFFLSSLTDEDAYYPDKDYSDYSEILSLRVQPIPDFAYVVLESVFLP